MIRAALDLEPLLAHARVLLVINSDQLSLARAIIASEPDNERWQIEVAEAQTSPVLLRMDVVVYAVQQDSHSLTIIKAQFAHRPVIAVSVGSVLELIDDEMSGLVIPVNDASGLASALVTLFDEPNYAAELAAAAYEQAVKRNGLDAVGSAWEVLYRGLLKGSAQTTLDAQLEYRRLSVGEGSNSEV